MNTEMPTTVFFSWQADTPSKAGRTFLKEVLEAACRSISADTTVDESLRDLTVDTDTKGIPGQPPIAETILRKIDRAAVFIADMTLTGTRKGGRPTPNPNVLIEYGWARKSLSYERIICIMNGAYGRPSSETLPFDLAHLRWPIVYTLPEDASAQDRAAEKQKLVKTLTDAIRASLSTIAVPPAPEPARFFATQPLDGPARFRAPGIALGYHADFVDSQREVALVPGPAMWLRVMPIFDQQKEWPTQRLRQLVLQDNTKLLPLYLALGGYSVLRASDGFGLYGGSQVGTAGESGPAQALSVAFAFRSGEIWSIDTVLMSQFKEHLHYPEMQRAFVEGLTNYALALRDLGLPPPYRWIAGLTGAQGRRLRYPSPPGQQWMPGAEPMCLTDVIQHEGEYNPGEQAASVLMPFFAKIFAECGKNFPAYLSQG